MTDLFLRLFNISATAGWIVIAALLVRLCFRKMPRWVCCLLWGVVGLRLMLPVTLESAVSLLPSAQVIPQDIAVTQTPAINSGIPAVNRAVNPLFATMEALPLQQILFWASVVWLAGMVLLLAYGGLSYIKLCRQVRISVCKQDDVYLCDGIETPFLLGLFRPRIYVPSGLDEGMLAHILAHEQAHIRRKDYLWKPLGFLLLCVYWFNPLLWVGYILLCRDIERACDERVIAQKDNLFRVNYMDALLACSLHRRMILTCPVAFGEVSVKTRVKGIVRYKKPTVWVISLSVATCALVTVCFLTSPKACAHEYTQETTRQPTCTVSGMQVGTCRLCNHTYMQSVDCVAHTYDEGRVTREASCTHAGIRIRQCTGCGQKLKKELPLLDHTPGALTVAKEPNCIESGAVRSECTVCRVPFITQVLEPTGVHTLERSVTKEVTCLEDGVAVDDCIVCDYKKTVELKAGGHVFKLHHKQDATCTMDGAEYYNCTGCDKKKEVFLPEDGDAHIWSDYSGRCIHCTMKKPTVHAPKLPTTNIVTTNQWVPTLYADQLIPRR